MGTEFMMDLSDSNACRCYCVLTNYHVVPGESVSESNHTAIATAVEQCTASFELNSGEPKSVKLKWAGIASGTGDLDLIVLEVDAAGRKWASMNDVPASADIYNGTSPWGGDMDSAIPRPATSELRRHVPRGVALWPGWARTNTTNVTIMGQFLLYS